MFQLKVGARSCWARTKIHKVVDIEVIRRPHTLNKKHYIRYYKLHHEGKKFEVNKSIPIDASLTINFVALLWTSSIAFTLYQ